MVHKKSEYDLQFRSLSNDLRVQIWKENFLFREAQKKMNLSDHYWRYQLIDDVCDCEDSGDIEVESIRLKNNHAVIEFQKQQNLLDNEEVQTGDWNGLSKDSPPCEESEARTIAENTNTSAEKEPESIAQPRSIVKTESTTANYPKSSDLLKSERTDACHRDRNESEVWKTRHYPQRVEMQPASMTYSGLNPLPSRNAIKSYHSEHRLRPVFAAFGWNDSDRDVGDQKTYNIRAPADQVHHTALLASSKKLKELELHFAEQLKKKRQQSSLLSLGPVNLSSIWMTEYQESFSRGQREHLIRHRASKRPIVWRYT